MSYTRLVSIDPGLAQLGWAVFDVTGLTKSPKADALVGRCLAVGCAKSLPSSELLPRLEILRTQTLAGVKAHAQVGETLVVIEKPSRPGGYLRRGVESFASMAGGMMGLHLATGYLAGMFVAEGYEVEFRAPNQQSKSARWERALALLGTLPVKRTNKETRDAIWLGCQVMLDARRVWG